MCVMRGRAGMIMSVLYVLTVKYEKKKEEWDEYVLLLYTPSKLNSNP